MSKDTFEDVYQGLNRAQKEAVDAIEGPVMVIAGPGTGKTQIVTLRIANILRKTDAAPENILALTFTQSGARAMRERLSLFIGQAAYRVTISTFHEFGAALIRQYPEAYDRIIGGSALTDIERILLFEDLITDGTIRLLRPVGNPRFYLRPIIDAIATMKQENITPHDFAAIISKQETALRSMEQFHTKGPHTGKMKGEYQKQEKKIARNRELLLLYQHYQAALQEKRRFDYEDMMVETVSALEKNEAMRQDLMETYQYILADEHQDVNGGQNRILELLTAYHDHPNLFVVGDEKQAIFRFQGASLENFLYFEDAFPGTKTIALTENYRSGQEILDAAHDLIEVEDGPQKELRVPLTAALDITSHVETREYEHQAVEDEGVLTRVEKLIKEGVTPHQIAIIVRTNREVEAYAVLLRKRNIPVRPSAESDVLSHPVTASVRALIHAVVYPEDEAALAVLLHEPYFNVPAEDLVRVLSKQSYSRPVSSIITDHEYLESIGVKDRAAVSRVAEVLHEARSAQPYKAPQRMLEFLIQESGLLELVMVESPLDGGRVIRRLYDEVEEYVRGGKGETLKDVAAMFQLRIEHSLPLVAPLIASAQNAVSVMTAHKAKGLEFDHVFVPHLTDALWGGRKTPQYFSIPLLKHLNADAFDEHDDERRLLYVAMTRARKGLSLSFSRTSTDGKETAPSRLLFDIRDELKTVVSTDEEAAAFDPLSAIQSAKQTHRVIEPSFLRDQLHERGLSVTALNNYLKSPWEYLYKNVFRIPEIQPLYLLKGTALHDVLRQITAHHTKEGAFPNATTIASYLERSLGNLPITNEEYVRLHEEGLVTLLTYLEHLEKTLSSHTKEEKRFEGLIQTNDDALPELKITGMLDRIDFDEEGNALCVIDYKTGKHKSRNVIEGKTKNADGDYKRQLVFYALLLSLQDDARYHTRTTALSFIEPDEKGKIHEETFTITDEEIDELKKELVRVAAEIAHGAFLTKPCDPDRSGYCHLVSKLVSPQGSL